MALTYIKVFHGWLEDTSELTLEEKGRLIDAMVHYARGDQVDLVGNERFLFPVFREMLNRDMERYDSISVRNQTNGAKGGRPRKTQSNPENPMGFLGTEKSQDKDKDKDKDMLCGQRKRFTPPTLEELERFMIEYAGEKSLYVDASREAEGFMDYYTSKGWRVGGNAPMKNWESAARRWLRNAKGVEPSPRATLPQVDDSVTVGELYG